MNTPFFGKTVQSATLNVPRLTADTTVELISWMKIVIVGTASSDQTMKKGLPAVKNLGEVAKDLEFDNFDEILNEDVEKTTVAQESADVGEEIADGANAEDDVEMAPPKPAAKVVPPTEDEYQWVWKVCMPLISVI